LLLDRAGWHTTAKINVPHNITPIFLPSRAPELNPFENVWQYLRAIWLSNRVFDSYEGAASAGRNLLAFDAARCSARSTQAIAAKPIMH
jgi:transposase